MIEIIGWASTIAFAVAGLPQVLKAFKDGNAKGISTGFLAFWYMGNVLGTIYALTLGSAPLSIGFLTSVLFGTILWKFKIWSK